MSPASRRVAHEALQVLLHARIPVTVTGELSSDDIDNIRRIAVKADPHVEAEIEPLRTPRGEIRAAAFPRTKVTLRESERAEGTDADADQPSRAICDHTVALARPALATGRTACLQWPRHAGNIAADQRAAHVTVQSARSFTASSRIVRDHRRLQSAFRRQITTGQRTPPAEYWGKSDSPAPRPAALAWEHAAVCLAATDDPRFHPDTAALIAEALLGTSIAAEYISFMEHKRLPDPESLLEDPASLRLPLRGDLKLACLRAVTAAVSDNCTARRWAAAFEVCIRAAQAGALDAAMVAAAMLAAIRPARVRLPAGYEILLAVAAELTKTGQQTHTSLSAETSPQDPAQPPSGTTARRLCAARYWIAKERPYYTTALFRCPLWTTRAAAKLSIDNRWRIYANPAHVASSTIEELALGLMHLTHHVLRAHDLRAPNAHNPAQLRAWNVAADCETNDALDSWQEVPDDWPGPWHWDLPKPRSAEDCFQMLFDRGFADPASGAVSWDDDGTERVHNPDCGSAVTGIRDAYEAPDDSDGVTDIGARLLRHVVANDVVDYEDSHDDERCWDLGYWAFHQIQHDAVASWSRG